MKEKQFQKIVIDAAHLYGWKVAHFRPARTAKGWRTPVAADGQGFPDLVLVKSFRLIFAELKTDTGRLSPHQRDWIDKLPGAVVWRPRDWDEIKRTLKSGAK